jgi:hypothetical protein
MTDAVLHGVQKTARTCPECGASFVPSAMNWRKIFCCDQHRQAFLYRINVRGKQLLVPAMASRATRDGTRGEFKQAGKKAASYSRGLMQRWMEEDRAAGRMPMVEFFALREKLYFNDNLL